MIIAFIALLGLSNCNRDKDCQDIINTIPVPINDSLRSKVPHTGFDTLTFFNQYGDTVVMRGVGVNYYNKEESQQLTRGLDIQCHEYNRYVLAIEEFAYIKDELLSNTSLVVPFKNISLVAGTSNNEDYLRMSLPDTETKVFIAWYYRLNDGWYTNFISINNVTYNCLLLRTAGSSIEPFNKEFYYNHYQGIIRLVENDTIIWNRKFN